MADLQTRTIADFGEQWTAFPDAEGYFGSAALFNDFFNPLLFVDDVAGCRIAEIGAGGGRFINVLAKAGAGHIVAIEPSSAFQVLRENTAAFSDRITYLNTTGDHLAATGDLDYVFAIGVLHHIPDPSPVVTAAFHALRKGGQLAIWLYGREGNALYLSLVKPLWWVTRRLRHRELHLFVRLLYPLLWCYMTACGWMRLPQAEYMRRVMLPLTPAMRRVVLYDQLNASYAKYYTRAEAHDLVARHGFIDIRLFHRHGVSWTVLGTKP